MVNKGKTSQDGMKNKARTSMTWEEKKQTGAGNGAWSEGEHRKTMDGMRWEREEARKKGEV